MYISWGNPQPWFRPKLSSRGYRITHGTLEVTAGWTAAKISFLNFEPILDSIHLLFWISNPILHQKNEIYIYINSWKSKVRKSDPVLLRPCWLPTGWKITPVFIGKSSISRVKKQKTALAFRFRTPCVCGKRGGTPESSRKKNGFRLENILSPATCCLKKNGMGEATWGYKIRYD